MNTLNDIFFSATTSEGVTYEQVLDDVQRYFSENHAATIAGEGDKAGELLRERPSIWSNASMRWRE